MYEVLWDGASLGLGKVWLSDKASAATAIVGLAVQCADFDMAYQTGVQRFWLHISYHGKIEHMTWGDRVFAAICHVLQYLLDGQDVVIHCVHGILRKCRCKRHGLDGIPRPHMLVLMLDTSVCLHQYGGIVSISLMGMRHLIHVRCMPCFPGRHRSGFFAILLLMVLSEVHGRWSWIQLHSAKETYFAWHPEFQQGDHNESKVESLIEKNLQGHNIHEFDDLGAAVVHAEVYERFKAKQADRTASPQLSARASSTSSSPPPWRRRGRSRVRSPRSEVHRSRSPVRLRPRPKVKSKARPKPKVHPEPKARPKSKARPKPKVVLRPGPKSMSSSSSGSRSEVPGHVDDEVDEHVDDEVDEQDDWVQRDCWACKACGSINLRFTQWCACGNQRDFRQVLSSNDWPCPECGNINFAWRTVCAWATCSSKDWRCICGNVNFARRPFCNRNDCQRPRPWIRQ